MHEHSQDDPEVLSEIEKLGYDPRDVPVEKTVMHAVMLFLSVGAVMGLAFTLFSASTPVWLIVPALLVNGVAQGLWMAPNMSVTRERLTPKYSARSRRTASFAFPSCAGSLM